MSRIFTTRFIFEEKEFVALVSVKKGDSKPFYTIRLFDEQLKDIIQNEVIECEGFEGYLQKLSLRSEIPRRLMSCIMSSIRLHMEKTNQTPAG